MVLSDSERHALRALVRGARYELIPLSSVRDRAGALPPGSTVTVTASPSHGIEATLTLAEWLASRGHAAIPHLSAHMIRDRAHLADLLARARAAGLREAFVVGGDAGQHTEFRDGLALLQAMHEIGHPFERIGVPAYPEGHADIPTDVLLRALKDKQHYAHSMTTQMSFNPGAVSAWIGRMRTEGVRLLVHLGVPGVTKLSKLMTIAARIGVADSARYLKKNRQMVGHLINPGSFGPDAFLEALAGTIADPAAHVDGVHLFTFNQVTETAAWQQRMADRLSSLATGGGSSLRT